MALIELRILSGARAGHTQTFRQQIVALGRHPRSDLQFNPNEDLDVSTRHAEILTSGGRVRIRDTGSTNGTFLNGLRIDGEEQLYDGDVIWLGAEGPKVEVVSGGGKREAGGEGVPETVVRTSQGRHSTSERVKVAIRRETAWMRRVLAGALVVLVGAVAGAYWMGHRESRVEVADLMRLLAASESTATRLQAQLEQVGDTTLLNSLRRQNADIASRVRATGAGATREELSALKDELLQRQLIQQGLAGMDLARISADNDAAIAFLVTELDGKPYGATAFGVGPNGLLVTNKHNVRSATGRPPTRIAVKYANTDVFLHGRVAGVAGERDGDVALIQVQEPGTYPVVAGVARSVASVHVGAPVAAIGYPLALDTPMDGSIVKTSLTAGTVSKLLPDLIQIDAFAGAGSSGSPVFDAAGQVIGVIWGGPPDGHGRLAYAVPSDRVAALLPADAQRILR